MMCDKTHADCDDAISSTSSSSLSSESSSQPLLSRFRSAGSALKRSPVAVTKFHKKNMLISTKSHSIQNEDSDEWPQKTIKISRRKTWSDPAKILPSLASLSAKPRRTLSKNKSGFAHASEGIRPSAESTKEEPPRFQNATKAATGGELNILVCSGNLGNAEPTPQDMKAWIPWRGRCDLVTRLPESASGNHDGSTFDMVVIGMQESTWMSSKASKPSEGDGENSTNDQDFPQAQQNTRDCMARLAFLIKANLGWDYTLVADKHRGQMRLIIFALRQIADDFSGLSIKCENTGIAHVWANKGGIVASLTYKKTTRISFLSAHLAAHEGDAHYAARCDSLVEILAGARCSHQPYDISINSHHCFVLGDLNFRTRFPTAPDGADSSVGRALNLIQVGQYEQLYAEHDELLAGIEKGDLLAGFQTPPCHFPPTFKVLRGEPGYVYNPKRTPSYTDRIFYKSATGELLRPFAYEACPGFASSDHKPIRGAFTITPNSVVNKRLAVTRGIQPPCSYRLKFRNMECTDIQALATSGSSLDPCILFTWDYVEMISSSSMDGHLRDRKSLMMKWNGRSCAAWPRTSKFLLQAINPACGGWEVNLHINGPRVGAEAILYVTVVDRDLSSQDDLVATLPLSLAELVSGLSPSNPTKQIELDRSLLKYGKPCGRIHMSVDMERLNAPLPMIVKQESRARKKRRSTFSSGKIMQKVGWGKVR